MVPEKFLKAYNPASTEGRIYKKWEESGFFNPDALPGKRPKPFTIIMPPPNVTGVLHMGHALMLTIEDVLIRFKRMRGFKALWLPGTDHAAIATQARVEKNLSKEEKKSRFDLGREEFLRRVEAFAAQSHDSIVNQVRAMGASCDWSREAYTLDERRHHAVYTVFKMMYDDGLIYRGNRIVNWDPKGGTTISDDEIVYEERAAKFVTFKYSKEFPIPVATTRLETKVGDTAVAVHPDDARYKKYIGKEYDLVFCEVPLHVRVVGDSAVDPSFGTGAVGVTPAHSQTDAEIALRHDLPSIQVIDERARMIPEGLLRGKKVLEAREMIYEWLKKEELLLGEEEIKQSVATAERTGSVIEPLPKLQWWIGVDRPIKARGGKTLKELMRAPVEEGTIEILPDHFKKVYYHWIDNLRDWCISRQIWYGHRIPVWYRGEEIYCAAEAPKGGGWEQDSDTLDTWFSSGLWTFSTLGWPEKTKDLELYHPTDVLETGYDILFFWVARMILMSEYTLGEIPFRAVYLHGMVRDGKGQKMSKSIGNILDPIHVAEEFGADAARMALVVGNTPGTDFRISNDKIRSYKLFSNKLWNIARFLLEQADGLKLEAPLSEKDAEYLSQFKALAEDITLDIDAFRLHLASEKLYQYLWSVFASDILEESKPVLKGEDPTLRTSRQAMLFRIFSDSLKLLHPFMPFVSEEIWESMPEGIKTEKLLMVEPWPI
ncbi:MAG: valine--tRNA ligase [Patescibacteria group bacterium]|nr:valine--tRNA ligase [Patescibacteria group bacterium]